MHLTELIPEHELKNTVLSDYKRKIVLYKFTNERLKKKYGMNYEEFEAKDIVKEKGLSWEAEKDAMDWEHAIEGTRYLQEKMVKIHEIGNGD